MFTILWDFMFTILKDFIFTNHNSIVAGKFLRRSRSVAMNRWITHGTQCHTRLMYASQKLFQQQQKILCSQFLEILYTIMINQHKSHVSMKWHNWNYLEILWRIIIMLLLCCVNNNEQLSYLLLLHLLEVLSWHINYC